MRGISLFWNYFVEVSVRFDEFGGCTRKAELVVTRSLFDLVLHQNDHICIQPTNFLENVFILVILVVCVRHQIAIRRIEHNHWNLRVTYSQT